MALMRTEWGARAVEGAVMANKEWPKIGDERFRLIAEDGGFRIEHVIRCEGGMEHYYDEETKDYIDVPGHWVRVGYEGGVFKSRADARDHMLARRS